MLKLTRRQRGQEGLAHGLLKAEKHVDDDFMLMRGTIFSRRILSKSSFSSEKVERTRRSSLRRYPYEETSHYGVCDTNDYDGIQEVVEQPDDEPLNLVMTDPYPFSSSIFHVCKLVKP